MTGLATDRPRNDIIGRGDRNRLCRFGDRLLQVRLQQADDGLGADGAVRQLGRSSTGWATDGDQVNPRQHERHAVMQPTEYHGVHDVVVQPQPARGVDIHPSPQPL